MTSFKDLANLAKAMTAAKVAKFSAGGVSLELHESAFAPTVSGQPQDPKAFLDMPTDEQLKFWSVEGDEEPNS